MMTQATKILAGATLMASLVLAACGSTPTTPPPAVRPTVSTPVAPTQPASAAAPAAPTTIALTQSAKPTVAIPTVAPPPTQPAAAAVGAETGGEGGVESALVTYADTTQHIAIGHPGTWTQDQTVTTGVQFNGGDDRMRLEFATLPTGGDVMAYAKQDSIAVSSTVPGFALVSLAASTEVNQAVVLGYTATGTSAVTGKAYPARADRYYIPLSDGRLAVLTISGPANHYDREGVRDIALTLKVTK